MNPRRPTPAASSWDAKTLAAIAALVTALAGGVELRVQVGLLAAKVDRIEAELRGPGPRVARGDPQ